jgi:hypothetical protein
VQTITLKCANDYFEKNMRDHRPIVRKVTVFNKVSTWESLCFIPESPYHIEPNVASLLNLTGTVLVVVTWFAQGLDCNYDDYKEKWECISKMCEKRQMYDRYKNHNRSPQEIRTSTGTRRLH